VRILLVTPMPPQRQGPGAIPVLLHAQVSALTRRHDVTLATVAGPDPAELSAAERLTRDGIETHYVARTFPAGLARWRRRGRLAGTWLRGRYPWRTVWFAEPALQQVIDRLLAGNRFDVVAVEDNAMAVYRFDTAVPLILTEYEVRRPRPFGWQWGPVRHWPRSALREADWARWPRYQRSVWRRFDVLQVFTPRDAAAVRTQAPELSQRVRVVPFGVDLPPEPREAGEEERTVLFVGNFSHLPNVDAALCLGREVMPQLRERVDGVRLQLIGPFAPEPVRALAGDAVEVIGEVPDIDPYLRRATLFLAPLRIGGGMRMKVLYAMAFAKAVVTTARGIDGLEVDGEEPPVAVADGVEAMVEAAAALLHDSGRRNALGDRARSFVERHFSGDAYARRLEHGYAEAMKLKTAERR
jgi:glycosyltransferase involved in cell wall biosynthesis